MRPRRRVRLTVRQLMLGIAALAVLLGLSIAAARLGRRALAYWQVADRYAALESIAHEGARRLAILAIRADQIRAQGTPPAADLDARSLATRPGDAWRADAARSRRAAEHYAALKRAYRHAAFWPWTDLPLTPPAPGPAP
jgi:hypothetical protein